MDKDTLSLFHRCFDEFKDLVRQRFRLFPVRHIEEDLIFLVKPIELQVDDSDSLPMIWYLTTRTVDNMGHFVCHYELKVLYTQDIL